MIRQRGISLLEVLLSISIISVIIVGGLRLYHVVVEHNQQRQVLRQLKALLQAKDSWLLSHRDADVADLTMQQLFDYMGVPASQRATPWGGQYQLLSYSPDKQRWTLQISALPIGSCRQLLRAWQQVETHAHAECNEEDKTWQGVF